MELKAKAIWLQNIISVYNFSSYTFFSEVLAQGLTHGKYVQGIAQGD